MNISILPLGQATFKGETADVTVYLFRLQRATGRCIVFSRQEQIGEVELASRNLPTFTENPLAEPGLVEHVKSGGEYYVLEGAIDLDAHPEGFDSLCVYYADAVTMERYFRTIKNFLGQGAPGNQRFRHI